MVESASSSIDTFNEPFSESINEALIDSMDNSFSETDNSGNTSHEETGHQTLDSRRRLEAKLAERYLEKDMREFDFDI